MTDRDALPAATRIGRTAFRVADLDAVVDFYREIVGLAVRERTASTATLGAGGTPLSCYAATLTPGTGARRPRAATGWRGSRSWCPMPRRWRRFGSDLLLPMSRSRSVRMVSNSAIPMGSGSASERTGNAGRTRRPQPSSGRNHESRIALPVTPTVIPASPASTASQIGT